MTEIKQNSAFLENERSIPLYPALAHAFGVQCAIILQQIRYWMMTYRQAETQLSEKDRLHFHEGRWWVYNTYEQWQRDNFGFWSKRTIQRHISALETMGVLLSGEFNKSTGDRTKWYTIDFDAMDELVMAKQEKLKASGQSVQMVSSKCPDHLDKVARSIYKETESTTETTQKESADPPAAVSPAEPEEKQKRKASKPKTLEDLTPEQRVVASQCHNIKPNQGITKRTMIRLNMVVGELRQRFNGTPVTPDELTRACKWHRGKGLTVPRDAVKVANMVQEHRDVVGYRNGPPRPSLHIPTPLPDCPMCGGTGMVVDADHKSQSCPVCLEAEGRDDRANTA